MKLKAIDTPYKNYLFRSRLEAKWAYYFDLFNVRWEYEKEGYELGDGIRYLPDFYFPDYRIYAEVKPILPTFKEHSKCKRLANLTQCKVIELVGLPSNRPMNVIMPSKRYVCSKCDSTNVLAIRRICGYLGPINQRPVNAGKAQEFTLRVKHC